MCWIPVLPSASNIYVCVIWSNVIKMENLYLLYSYDVNNAAKTIGIYWGPSCVFVTNRTLWCCNNRKFTRKKISHALYMYIYKISVQDFLRSSRILLFFFFLMDNLKIRKIFQYAFFYIRNTVVKRNTRKRTRGQKYVRNKLHYTSHCVYTLCSDHEFRIYVFILYYVNICQE